MTCARPRSSTGFGRARWRRPGAGLGIPDASAPSQGTPICPRHSPRLLTWQPQLWGSVALCGRGLPAPRRAAGAPARAPASSAHPPGPSGGGGSSRRVQAGQTPSACGHQTPDQPRSPAPNPDSPPHPNARAGPVILFPARPAAASASAPRGGGANLKTHSPHRVPIGIPWPQRQLPENSVPGQLLPSVFCSWRKSRGRETLPAKPVPLSLSAPLLLEDT